MCICVIELFVTVTSTGKVTITNTIRKVLAARAMQNVVKTQDSIMVVTEKKLQ